MRIGLYAAVVGLALALTGCEAPQPRPEPKAPPPPPPVVAPAPPAPLEPDRPGLSLQNYQKEIAQAIVRANHDHTYTGKLPPLLRSVVVVQISIDAKGALERVTMLRSNGFVELEKTAIAAVQRAAPFPIPGRSLLAGNSNITFTESLLFRNDGRFQVRSVAEQQSTEVESKPARGARSKPK